ncbi:hypothetical protein [Endozoicomonas ascidiicola]|uniref:hypothetical protein n=1 Tax=Endozoicomonas ascidiicola TaxID=1698521 RepID=UPI00083279C0|nr:hypothetical protein [Endozoicomonas ascidiicola]
MLKNIYFSFIGSENDGQCVPLHKVSRRFFIQELLLSEEAEESEEYLEEWFFPYPEHRALLVDSSDATTVNKLTSVRLKAAAGIHCGRKRAYSLSISGVSKHRPSKIVRWNSSEE